MFLGMNLPTNEQIVYDNNGYYDDRTGGNSGTNPETNKQKQNLLGKLGNSAPISGGKGILPSNNGTIMEILVTQEIITLGGIRYLVEVLVTEL